MRTALRTVLRGHSEPLAVPRYYVATAGDDSKDGTTIATAWKTVAKVNAASFAPNSQILFNRGDVWREKLVVPSSGTDQRSIVFGAYGSGNKPQLLGSVDLSATGDWTADSSSASITVQTANTTDDAIVVPGWGNYFDNSYLAMGNNGGNTCEIGMRFTNLTIPQGATITSAVLRQKCVATHAQTTCLIRVKGEANAAPATFSNYADFAGRTRTTAAVDWTVSAQVAGTIYSSPDLKTVVQEVVNLGGWASGHNLTIFCADNGSTANAQREPAGFESASGANGPWLDITYATGTPSVWKTTATIADPGLLVFDNEASVGVKKTTKGALGAQGEFYWAANVLYVFSASNPGSFYSHIECGTNATELVLMEAKNYVTVQDFDLRYARHGVNINAWHGSSTGITLQRSRLDYCGGIYGGNAIGGGMQIYAGAHSGHRILFNTCNQPFDSGFCPCQDTGYDQTSSFTDIILAYNLVTNGENSFEIGGFRDNGGTTVTNLLVANNTSINAGKGRTHAIRSDPLGGGIIQWGTTGVTHTNVRIVNNLCLNGLFAVLKGDSNFSGITYDYNAYFNTTTFGYNGWPYPSFPITFAAWQAATSQDAHSISADPLVVSASDFHLQAGSPAINAGTNVGLVADLDDYPVGASPDIGAYEWH